MPVHFEAVAYQLPKSKAFGQESRLPCAAAAWEETQSFLRELTHPTLLDHTIHLRCRGDEQSTDRAIVQQCIDEAQQLFGPGIDSGIETAWHLQPEQLTAAVAFALTDDRWARQKSGPIWLAFGYRFNWAQPFTLPEPLASWQSGICSLGLIFSRQRLSLQPQLVFPLPHGTPEFAGFVQRVAPALPFELRQQYLRRMQVNSTRGTVRLLTLAAK